VDAEELSQHVDELELRLERLRVLYDQYFMGIEKVPPAVPQKDVDRRIWVLRREKIRNTGVRFKFQTIIQRYSTFHSYWMRIMREIENGTYKRHVQRAKRRFGEDPTAPPRVDAAREAPSSIELDDANTFDVDLDLLDDDATPPSTGDDLGISTAPPPPPASRPPAILSPLGTMRGPAPLPTAPAPAAGAPTTGAPATAAPPARPPLPARAGPVAPSPAAPTTAVAAAARPAPPPSKPAPLPASPPPSPSNKAVTTTAPVVASAVSSTAVTQPRAATTEPKPQAATASVPKILAAKVRNDDDLDAMLNEALGGPGGVAGPARPEPRLPSTTTQGVGPSRPSDARSAPLGTATAPSAPKPAAAAAVPASRPAARPAAAPAPHASAVAGGGGDFRQVYAKYVEARRNNGESTAGLTYESLAKNLRDTTEKLKTKSGGKPIDFDVVVKDGKTILKPVVK